MNILIVEDDTNKLESVRSHLSEIRPSFTLSARRSYRTGLAAALSATEHYAVVLDMTLPTFDISPTEKGGRIRPFGGREILAELARKNIRTKAIVLTQFESFGSGPDVMTLDQLQHQLSLEFGGIYVATIFYAPAESAWKDELVRVLDGIARDRP